MYISRRSIILVLVQFLVFVAFSIAEIDKELKVQIDDTVERGD
ncbi:MAG: hypothetical protein ACUVWN_11035 [bacterium]